MGMGSKFSEAVSEYFHCFLLTIAVFYNLIDLQMIEQSKDVGSGGDRGVATGGCDEVYAGGDYYCPYCGEMLAKACDGGALTHSWFGRCPNAGKRWKRPTVKLELLED